MQNSAFFKVLIITILFTVTLFADLPAPIAHYTFDDGTAADSSGNDRHGQLVGQTKIVDDPVRGKVLQISSDANSWVDCGGGGKDGWATLQTVTVSAWVKTDRFIAENQFIVSKGGNYAVGRFAKTDHLRFFTAGFKQDGDQFEGKADIQDGNWHLVTFVRDAISGRRGVYVDGQVDSYHSLIKKLQTNDLPLLIGGQQDSPESCWVGLIDDVRIYDQALTLRQMRTMCQNAKPILPEPADSTGNLENNVTLQWQNQIQPISQQLYFGTSYYAVKNSDPSVDKGLVTNSSFNTGPLKSATTYYWKVNVTTDSGTLEGYTWSFRTKTEGFYMDLFKDGGLKLTSTPEMPAADFLALSNEYLAVKGLKSNLKKETEIQNAVFHGNDIDENGFLLYPDGEPRFRCLFIAGGVSVSHGKSLTEKGRQTVTRFFLNGGSYTGSCAGAFLTSIKVHDTNHTESAYFHIWPAETIKASGIYKVDYDIPEDSPLLQYSDFNHPRVPDVQHWNGPYIISDLVPFWCENTEVLARFSQVPKGKKNANQGNVSLWSYKKDSYSGRIIPISSHPEDVPDGQIRDMMAAILQYALDGQGNPKVKTVLKNNIVRDMNDNSSPDHEKIGDLQYHHFLVNIPAGTKKLTVTLDGQTTDDLNLYAKFGSFAFADCDNFVTAENSISPDEKIVIKNPKPGSWYIGVKGVNTVKTQKRYWGYEYTDNLHLLNGLPYSIKASWD